MKKLIVIILLVSGCIEDNKTIYTIKEIEYINNHKAKYKSDEEGFFGGTHIFYDTLLAFKLGDTVHYSKR
jgi:hypothetical protein